MTDAPWVLADGFSMEVETAAASSWALADGFSLAVFYGAPAVYSLSCGTAAFVETGSAATAKRVLTLSLVSAAFAETGSSATGKTAKKLPSATGQFAESGSALTVKLTWRLSSATGQFAETASSATAKSTRSLSLAQAAYAQTPSAATLGRGVIATSGIFTEAGSAIKSIFVLTATTAAFAETPSSITARSARKAPSSSASFAFSANAMSFAVGKSSVISASTGVFVSTPSAATLKRARSLLLNSGAFVESGNNLTPRTARKAPLVTPSYLWSGDAIFVNVLLHSQAATYADNHVGIPLTAVVPLPPTYSVGDLLVIQASVNQSTSGTTAPIVNLATPSGWAVKAQFSTVKDSTTWWHVYYLFTKIASASESAVTLTAGGSGLDPVFGAAIDGIMRAYSNASGINSFASVQALVGGASIIPALSETFVRGELYVVLGYSYDFGANASFVNTFTPPTNHLTYIETWTQFNTVADYYPTGPGAPGTMRLDWTGVNVAANPDKDFYAIGYSVKPLVSSVVYSISANSGIFTQAGSALTGRNVRKLPLQIAAFAEIGSAAFGAKGRSVSLSSSAFAEAGSIVAPRRGIRLASNSGAFAESGSGAFGKTARSAVANAAAFAETGAATKLAKGFKTPLVKGIFSEVGNVVTTGRQQSLTLVSGVFSETGSLTRANFGVIANAAAFVETSSSIAVKTSRALSLVRGTFTETGSAAKIGFGVRAVSVAFTWTALSASVRASKRLPLSSGVFTDSPSLTGVKIGRRSANVTGSFVESPSSDITRLSVRIRSISAAFAGTPSDLTPPEVGRRYSLASAVYSYAGTPASFSVFGAPGGYTISATSGVYALSPSASFGSSSRLSVEQTVSFAESGSQVLPGRGSTVILSLAAFSWASSSLTPKTTRKLGLTTGQFQESASSVSSLTKTSVILAAAGVFAETPSSIVTKAVRRIDSAPGSFNYGVKSVSPSAGWRIAATSVGFNFIGHDAALRLTVPGHPFIVADSGLYAFSGAAAASNYGRLTHAGIGQFTWAPNASDKTLGRGLAAATGRFVESGSGTSSNIQLFRVAGYIYVDDKPAFETTKIDDRGRR